MSKNDPQYRPGSLSWYLREYGWTPVSVPDGFPLWEKEGSPAIPASKAILEVYRQIWRDQRPTVPPKKD